MGSVSARNRGNNTLNALGKDLCLISNSITKFVCTICSFLLRDYYYTFSDIEPSKFTFACNRCGRELEMGEPSRSYALYGDIWRRQKIRMIWFFHLKCHEHFLKEKMKAAGSLLSVAFILCVICLLFLLISFSM